MLLQVWAPAFIMCDMSSFDVIESKMKSVGLSEAAINAFRYSVHVLESKQSMVIPESDIVPAEGVADWEALVASTPAAEAVICLRRPC